MLTLQVINIISMDNLTSYQIKHGGVKVKSKCLITRDGMRFSKAGFISFPFFVMFVGKIAK